MRSATRKTLPLRIALALMSAGLLLGAGCASPPRPEPNLEEAAESQLEAMAALLQDAEYVQYQGRDLNDVLLDDGHLIQEEGAFSVALARPNRLRVDSSLGPFYLTLWYDGEEVTIYERNRNLLARAEADSDLDTFMDDLIEEYDITFPGQEFLYADLVDELTAWLETGRLVGTGAVGDHAAYHLAFTQEQIHWDLWLDAETVPVPRRLVIEETGSTAQYEYRAEYEAWSFEPVPDADLAPDVPADAEEIPMEQLAERLEEGS